MPEPHTTIDRQREDRETTAVFCHLMRPASHDEPADRVAARQNEAFALIYSRAARVCRAVCALARIEPGEREDLFQQTMMELFAAVKAGRFDGACTVFTFAYTIAQRRCVDHVRKLIKRALAEEGTEMNSRQAADMETSTCARAALAQVREAHPRWVEAFVPLALGEVTVEQTVASLAVTDAWFRNIVMNVRKAIREACLAHCGVDDCTEVSTA
jgi:DNA-directed RNA polymerase specialized sigma24 family protein